MGKKKTIVKHGRLVKKKVRNGRGIAVHEKKRKPGGKVK